ncbi:MAG: L,D-transpeptidase [Acidobacteriota bacterium]
MVRSPVCLLFSLVSLFLCAPRLYAEPGNFSYRLIQIAKLQDLKALRSELGDEQFEVVLKLNRRDSRHLGSGISLIIPDTVGDLISHSPFPRRIDAAASVPKLMFVSLSIQAFAAYEYGELVRWGPASTGKQETPTPAGLYHVNWRSKRRVSTKNPSWIMPWCVNLHTATGIAFHQYKLPGYPASHGCIRLFKDDARWIFDWADLWVSSEEERAPRFFGTAVIVFGRFAYGQDPPWLKLDRDLSGNRIYAAQIKRVLGRYFSLIERRAREAFLYNAVHGEGNQGRAGMERATDSRAVSGVPAEGH